MSMPSLDIHEKGDELSVSVDLPRVKGEDVDVRLDRDVPHDQRRAGDPSRTAAAVELPRDGAQLRPLQPVDAAAVMPDPNQVSADFEHGVLQIRMKRHAEQERSRRIEVRTGDPKGPAVPLPEQRPGPDDEHRLDLRLGRRRSVGRRPERLGTGQQQFRVDAVRRMRNVAVPL
jgi:HSP20 family molecular chaperone IbpA